MRDRSYQSLLRRGNPEATENYSLHTTGWSFDILRRYSGGRQARALQYALDRLEALDLIAWVRGARCHPRDGVVRCAALERLLVERGG